MTAPSPVLIEGDKAWRPVADALPGCDRLAVDMEADGFHRYPEQVSLIQLGVPGGRIWLIDPLSCADLNELGAVLSDPTVEKVFHSADFDLRSLDRDFGFHIAGLYDTSIAAQFVGSARTGLANVLEEHLGVTLDKSKRLQRNDWSRRPLSDAALIYAAADVEHLFVLADTLKERLHELGRSAWVAEECRRLESVRYRRPCPPDMAFLNVSGARSLSDAERSVLRELVVFREAEARRTGRPPYRLLSDKALMVLAERPNATVRHLDGVNRQWLSGAEARLRSALDRGRSADPVPWPRHGPGVEWSHDARDRLRALKRWRTAEADRLSLDPGIVWPVDHLKRLAMDPAIDVREADCGRMPWVRRWQWEELGPSLERYLSRGRRFP